MKVEEKYLDGIEMVVDYDRSGIMVTRRWWPRDYTYSLTIDGDKLIVSYYHEDHVARVANPYYQPRTGVICERPISEQERKEFRTFLAYKLARLPFDYHWFFYYACRSLIDAIRFVDEVYWKRMFERSAKPIFFTSGQGETR
jgi:hypothetical protein